MEKIAVFFIWDKISYNTLKNVYHVNVRKACTILSVFYSSSLVSILLQHYFQKVNTLHVSISSCFI